MAQSAAFRFLADLLSDLGRDPSFHLDTDEDERPLRLEGFKECVQQKKVVLPADVDVSITIPDDIIALVVYSSEPIQMRLAAGETQLTNLRLFTAIADDELDEIMAAGAILLTGNTTNEAVVRIIYLVKP